MSLRDTLNDDLKNAMRGRESDRVMVYRLIFSEIKQKEVDGKKTLTDADILSVLEKMIKQRKDSIHQFSQANRQDLVDKETAELHLIASYLPKPLSEGEIQAFIDEAIRTLEATKPEAMQGNAAMGAVIGFLRPLLAGKADMGAVSGLVKKSLSSSRAY